MDDRLYEEAKNEFARLVWLRPPDRAGHLKDLQDRAPELRAAVETLLLRDTELRTGADPTLGPDDIKAEVTVGSSVGPYRLICEIGRGGQGVVYLATDTRLRRQVALKLLRGLGPGADRLLRRFRREADIAARLNHPSICTVHEAGVADGVPYIAMEYVEGGSLRRRIREAGGGPEAHGSCVRLTGSTASDAEATGDSTAVLPTGNGRTSTPREWRDIIGVLVTFEQAARALHVMHEANVVHRDIKPENIMVLPDGSPMIMDFGLAREEGTTLSSLTLTGDFFGTPAYMSPEQLTRHAMKLDRRTDVWSLGVCLFECLTLRRPFEGATRQALYQAILGKDPPSARRINPNIYRDLEAVLETALEKDRDRRYQTALAFALDLQRVREWRPIGARFVTRWTRMVRWMQRNLALTTAITAAALVLVAGVVAASWFASLSHENQAAAEEARRELSHWQRLSDAHRLEELVREARVGVVTWPPAREAAIHRWLVRARELTARLGDHRAALWSLRTRANEWTAPDAPGSEKDPAHPPPDDPGLSAPTTQLQHLLAIRPPSGGDWTFDDPRDRYLHDSLQILVSGLEGLLQPPKDGHVTIASVERALLPPPAPPAETGEPDPPKPTLPPLSIPSEDAFQAEWAEAMARIAGNPKYPGLELVRQRGLIPLGADPSSGLEEFAEPRTGFAPTRDPATGRLQVDGNSGLVLVLLPGGRFTMGAQDGRSRPNFDPSARLDERPPHAVTLAPFFLSKFEMTNRQWDHATASGGGSPSAEELMAPVDDVSWVDGDAALRGLGLRLPTEAQWEYACRATTLTPWWTGEEPGTLKGAENLLYDGPGRPTVIGRGRPNPFGLYDMHGNVWEWCRDAFISYDAPVREGDGFRDGIQGNSRVYRGGRAVDSPQYARSSLRSTAPPDHSVPGLGIRPSRAIERR